MVSMGELVGELVFGIISLLIGFAVGSLVFVLVRAGRLALVGTERSAEVTDRAGNRWLVRIPLAPYPLRFWTSKRLLAMRHQERRRRQASGVDAAGVSTDEIAHPKKLVDVSDEAASIVAVGMLLFALVALTVLLLEAILALLAAVVVFLIRSMWGRWQCEVIGPDEHRALIPVGSLREARRRRAEVATSISSSLLVDLDAL